MWDAFAGEDGEDGLITDIELKNLFAPAVAKIFIFLDHCNSGGMNEIMSNSNAANIYITTTCGPRGYGYDVPQYQNGKWTYWFLEKGLVELGFTTMESCFSWAYAQYNASGQDAPRQFDGNTLFLTKHPSQVQYRSICMRGTSFPCYFLSHTLPLFFCFPGQFQVGLRERGS